MVAIYFYLIYHSFVLIFTPKWEIGFINTIAFRGLTLLFIHKILELLLSIYIGYVDIAQFNVILVKYFV